MKRHAKKGRVSLSYGCEILPITTVINCAICRSIPKTRRSCSPGLRSYCEISCEIAVRDNNDA
eukprot:1751015-Pyramimonas_sp.AAC.1